MVNDILQLLQGAPGSRFSHKEVGRIVDRRQYREDMHWARPVLERLVYDGIIVKEETLYFFPVEEAGEDGNGTPDSRSVAVGPVQTHELKVDPDATLEIITPSES